MIPAGTRGKERGFTVIELLVVISIIGLLSTIVYANVGVALEKARNANRLSDMDNYLKAFEFAINANDEYPDPGNSITLYCLGEYLDNNCWAGGNSVAENSDLNIIIREYFPGLPYVEGLYGTTNYEGYIYQCLGTGGKCTGFLVRWTMEGESQSCGQRGEKVGSSGGLSFCEFTRQP